MKRIHLAVVASMAVLTFVFGLLVPGPFKSLTWPVLIIRTVLLYVFLSILLFSVSVIYAAVAGRKAQSESELESVMVPAMRAEDDARHVPERITAIFRAITLIVLGIVLGTAGVLLLRKP